MENELIKYKDFFDKAGEYTSHIVWQGSREQLINSWLNPIRKYAKDYSDFYGISSDRDCGWYIEKSDIIKMLKETIPLNDDDELNKILNKLLDYIHNYKETKN